MASGSDDALLSYTIFQYFDAFEKRIFMLYKKANQEDKVTAIDAFSQVILALNGSSELTSGAPL